MAENQVKPEPWNSRGINFHLTSRYPQVEALIVSLLDEVIAHIKSRDKPKRIHTAKLKKSLSLVLLNLYSLHKVNRKKYVGYPRNPGGFQRTRYKRHNVGFDVFKNVIDTLDELGYLESHLGYYVKEIGIGKNSRIRANISLIELFKEHKLAPIMVEREKSEEVIILKSVNILKDDKKDKFRVDYVDTKQTNQMRNNLHSFNALLDSRWIDLNVSDKVYEKIAEKTEKKKNRSDIDFNRKLLKRIFNNNSFEDGGRFYNGWWQEIPKEYRKFITIDGKRTVEVDYSSIHFRILYAEQGIDIGDDDPYIIEGYEDRRSQIKIALNIILNAETKDKAINAIAKKEKLNINKKTALTIYDKLEERHSPIKQYFGSGRGIKLQYKDSQIAEQVMLNLAKSNIVCLPVHDSFIVRASNQIELHEEMDKAFKDIVGIETRRERNAIVVGSDVHKEEAKRVYGDRGHKFYDEEGNLEGVIISGADINPDELFKIGKEYEGCRLREKEWVEHRGSI
ncbi:hypothetical protein N9M98_01930 [Candidatus Pseudothioglobus singularis]|nr:hypothetical protein [Candidatus Pseudothioglobus singularis]